jgi:trimeric autotransporter adhesin
VSATNTIVTAAGVGVAGGVCSLPSSGDGGPATLGRLRTPGGVASDGSGGFWVTEGGGNNVRFVSSIGTISTVAGIGGASLGTTSSWNGPGTSARLNNPVVVMPDGQGGALFSGTNLNAIQRLLPSGVVSTVTYAGNGLSGTTGWGRR